MSATLPAAFTPEHASWVAGLLQGLLRPEVQAEAARLVQSCEPVPGFAALVATLATEPSTPLPESARLIAVICCLNFVRRHWAGARDRSRAAAQMSESDRGWLRDRFVRAALSERSELHAAQWALVVARVARADWPHAWPVCFALVSEACLVSARRLSEVASPDIDLAVRRSARVLLEMLGDVASKTLPAARMNTAALCTELVGSVATLWGTVHAAYVSRLRAAAEAGGLSGGAAAVESCARLAPAHRTCTKLASLVLRSMPADKWAANAAAPAAVVELGRGLAALLAARLHGGGAGVYAAAAGSAAAAAACDKAASTLAKAALSMQDALPLVLAATGATEGFARVRQQQALLEGLRAAPLTPSTPLFRRSSSQRCSCGAIRCPCACMFRRSLSSLQQSTRAPRSPRTASSARTCPLMMAGHLRRRASPLRSPARPQRSMYARHPFRRRHMLRATRRGLAAPRTCGRVCVRPFARTVCSSVPRAATQRARGRGCACLRRCLSTLRTSRRGRTTRRTARSNGRCAGGSTATCIWRACFHLRARCPFNPFAGVCPACHRPRRGRSASARCRQRRRSRHARLRPAARPLSF